jgi:hypothetical protein
MARIGKVTAPHPSSGSKRTRGPATNTPWFGMVTEAPVVAG